MKKIKESSNKKMKTARKKTLKKTKSTKDDTYVDDTNLELNKLVHKINDENKVTIRFSSDELKTTFRKVVDIVNKYLPFLSLSFFVPSFLTLKNNIQRTKTIPVLAMYFAVVVFAVAYFFVLLDFRKCRVEEKSVDGQTEKKKIFEGCDTYNEFSKQELLNSKIVNPIYTNAVSLFVSNKLLDYIWGIKMFSSVKISSPILGKLFSKKVQEVCFQFFEFKLSPNKPSTINLIFLAAIEAVRKEMFNFDKYQLIRFSR
jgi:hypothetical protein